MDNELWREDCEDHPVSISYRTDEGVVVRIEDRRTQMETWSKFVSKVRRTKEKGVGIAYSQMDEKNKAVIQFCEEVIDMHGEKMEVMENV